MDLTPTRSLDHKKTPSILAEKDERELVLQVQQAVDVVLGSAAEQMGVDKADLSRVLWKNGLLRSTRRSTPRDAISRSVGPEKVRVPL